MTIASPLWTGLVLACGAGLVLPFMTGGKPVWRWQWTAAQIQQLVWGGSLLGLAALLAVGLHLAAAQTLGFALAGFAAMALLSGLSLPVGVPGLLLVIVAFFIGGAGDAQIPIQNVQAYLLGLLLAQLALSEGPSPERSSRWLEFLWPAIFGVGSIWIALTSPQNGWANQQGLLLLSLAIAVLLRSVSLFPVLSESKIRQALFVSITSGLLAWLGIQNALLQPNLSPWAFLIAGGSLLGFGLAALGSVSSSKMVGIRAMQLLLLGLATLVASRLFGSTGWLVLAASLLSATGSVAGKAAASNLQTGSDEPPAGLSVVGLASLFLVGRVLLQTFIVQFNPNVTGINITHPYASAALYVGFAVMLLLPSLLKATKPASETQTALSHGFLPVVLGAIALLSAGLANYFLHAEATGSFLTALWVTGIGVTLLGPFTDEQSRFVPLQLAFLTTLICLLSPELIEAGNLAEKNEKLWVLTGAFIVYSALALLIQKQGSGRQAVPVA
ncbi:hypothetical protein [Vampirovibrio chlorellavorus]|uniref:hypothetical protein n=1 Tax=Vampirovibrio chlorellavorus TaxID=758823 RepID=UPI0026EC5E84|nr:hypothetical protein [Vampirovibrio chlorellavorus]